MDQHQAREAAINLARIERAELEHVCTLCDGGGWVCEEHPDRRGRDRTPAHAARPAHHTLTATAEMPTIRRGCRKASSLMLKARHPTTTGHPLGDAGWQGPCRPGPWRDRPDEPTADKPDGSFTRRFAIRPANSYLSPIAVAELRYG